MASTLLVVGSGIGAVSHLTIEAQSAIEQADTVFHAVADPVTLQWIKSANSDTRSLDDCYGTTKSLADTYREMVGRVVARTVEGGDVCAVFYGHPGVFVYAGHEAVRQARAAGCSARMLPGISTLDCLIADLGIDPSGGLQLFEASDFVIHRRVPDTTCSLILMQVSHLGEITPGDDGVGARYLPVLQARLLEHYSEAHPLCMYEASQFSVCPPNIQTATVGRLAQTTISKLSTLYLPPARELILDESSLRALGITL